MVLDDRVKDVIGISLCVLCNIIGWFLFVVLLLVVDAFVFCFLYCSCGHSCSRSYDVGVGIAHTVSFVEVA